MNNTNWDDVVWDEELGEFVPQNASEEKVKEVIETKDSNGNVLQNGDGVSLIKDLNVKGSTLNLKRGTKIKNIKLTDDSENIECKIGKSVIVLKTCFLKKC